MLKPKLSIQQLQSYTAPEEGRLEALRLDFNENLLGASPKVMEALQKISQEECGCYPEYEVFETKLSQFLGINQENLMLTNGSDEAIRAIFDAYVEKGDQVILLAPSYSMYEFYAQIAEAEILWVHYRENFVFPLEEILEKISSRTRLIALANPNNPTGTLIPREDLIKIIEQNSNMAVLIDEAYGLFAGITNLDLTKKYANVFVTQTFSKAYGLAGLRIGYLVSASPNIETISKILSPTYSVNIAAMSAASAAVEDQNYVTSYVQEVIATREFFIQEVNNLGFKAFPSQANFVMIDFGIFTEEVKQTLKLQKILVREREDLKGLLRITIGTKEQMQRVVEKIKSICPQTTLVFDMDGVLIDESRSYRTCILKTVEDFAEREIDPKVVEQYKQTSGYNNDYDCIEAILDELGVMKDRQEIVERFDDYYQLYKFQERWLLEEQLLKKLKLSFRLAIFTGRPKRDALEAINRFQKKAYFEVIITDDDVKQGKPDPEGLILAIESLKAKKAIYIGDSLDDRKAAERASVEFIHVDPPAVGLTEILERLLCQKEP